jgi:hypothetical protein
MLRAGRVSVEDRVTYTLQQIKGRSMKITRRNLVLLVVEECRRYLGG